MDRDFGSDQMNRSQFDEFLISDQSTAFRHALSEFRLALDLDQATNTDAGLFDLREAADLIADTIHSWVEAGAADWVGPTSWLSPDGPMDMDVFSYRVRAGELLAYGSILMQTSGTDPDRLANDMTRLAFGVDINSIRIGDMVNDRFNVLNLNKIPLDLDTIQELLDRTCVAGIVHAAQQFGRVASQHPRPMPGAEITDVDPEKGCGGDEVALIGTGFGPNRPNSVTVMFTNRDGGCSSAQIKSWTETKITVTAPDDVGHGCVGLIEHPPAFGEIASAATVFAGELETCLGPAAIPSGERIRGSANKIMASACPTCDNPRARFLGGPPVVKNFAGNGRSPVEILPGEDITVTWNVEGADDVSIVSVQSVLPSIPAPYDPKMGTFLVEDIELPDGTTGSWRLVATNRCGTTVSMVEVVVRGRRALVLSGGGAKSAFEVGAVRCLQDIAGLRFDILSGASSGALNAAKLAEGGTPALSGLERLWLSVQSQDDFYIEPRWFKTLEPVIRNLFRGGTSDLAFEAARFVGNLAINKMLGAFASAIGVPGIVYSVVTSLYPVVTGIIDVAKYVRAVQDATSAVSLFQLTPIQQMIQANIDPAKIAKSGIELRITSVALESGRARIFNQDGMMMDSGFRVPLRDAILASCSIPIAFPPVPLQGPNGTENYVDGGVRENVPVAAAVQAGAHRVYTILVNPPQVDAAPRSFSQSTMVKLAGRALDLFLDEAQWNDIEPFRGFGVPTTLIAPTFLVHTTFLVDPGLISINMDYGYMRAYDEVVATAAMRPKMRQLTDEIIALRVEIWSHETTGLGEDFPWETPWQNNVHRILYVPTLQLVRDEKKQLRMKVYERIGLSNAQSVPQNRSQWWQEWERHPWNPLGATPWERFEDRLGNILPAEQPPPA